MYLTTEKKKEIFEKFGTLVTNTGSSEGQIALLTQRIKHMTEHLKKHRKDFHTQKSLINLVGKRRKLLKYIKNFDINRYRIIIKELNLRK
ncbi:30S ribosomal protein S15 [Candidatus Walczuchella monophlebidarum]|uniref:Small ribosomal subunit protein uS15 n=1 Tax=Candidatus Walczuchella monophlebidarum TaxID=1415657 RepID=A0A068DNY9_9FLAO|nr:30S ribosomal protein S15 [Candidatus Walczuchella monophlebidarum]AID37465.1 ribosomal protein S15 [Candidatus Walczuchella monophlebidarum]